MSLLTLRQIRLSLGGPPVLDGISLTVERGERIALIGRNGEGKSTLLRVIAGEQVADEGERVLAQGARVARLEQEVPAETAGDVYSVIAAGLGAAAGLLDSYHAASHAVAEQPDEANLARLARAEAALQAADAWRLEQRIETLMSRMQLDADAAFDSLSGGMRRRVLLARALINEPDLLLLDEPTNHLDIEAIRWLEEFLLGWNGALLFVTHDRAFLERLATRIIELDRGGLASFPGDWNNYLRRRGEREHAEAQATAEFQRVLAQEEVWIRQGIKARRTRNEGRVRRLEAMRVAARERRTRQGKVQFSLNQAEFSGQLVCEAENISYSWEDRPLVRDFSTRIMRGDRVGIIGPNGAGKTTLLRLLLGELAPDSGVVRLGTRLEVAYFDQLRAELRDDKTLVETVGEGSDKVMVGGAPKHVMGYLQDFLFSPERARQPVKSLSGGERNRLLLARLFCRPANLLVLDEPTNDLDMESLELLEELLLDFDGTLLLVSHDRAFLDRCVTSLLVFEGDGRVEEYVGGYSDWKRQADAAQAARRESTVARVVSDRSRSQPKSAQRKLSYMDQRELEALPARIEQLEQEVAALQQQLADPSLYKSGPEQAAVLQQRLAAAETALEAAFDRWGELEAQTTAGG